MQCHQIKQLAKLLRQDGDKILDASSKLSLSSSLLAKLNDSLASIAPTDSVLNDFIDLGIIYDFMQQTLALKLFSDCEMFNADFLDLKLFHELRLLEIHRLGLNLVKGLKNLRSQLEYVTCVRSLTTLKDVLESCGADKTQGYVWGELKEAVFSHNNLNVIDGSLEFTPWLRSLDLSYNYIKNVETLNCLTNLKHLNLANNKIEALPIFKGHICNNLQVLILRNNYIEDIKEIEALFNLRELDLSNNSILDYDSLLPLTTLSQLQWLSLKDNPLSYHANYRLKTASYLHTNNAQNFMLDKAQLNKKERRALGSKQPRGFLLRSESLNSTTTASTVVFLERAKHNIIQTSDMEVSSGSVEVTREQSVQTVFEETCRCTNLQEQGMHDSGFVAGPRPISPSDSIDTILPPPTQQVSHPISPIVKSHCSATSLQSDDKMPVLYSESDIEILSNPSQSSIEVLSSIQAPRCVRSCVVIPQSVKEICTDTDLKTITEELHRSL